MKQLRATFYQNINDALTLDSSAYFKAEDFEVQARSLDNRVHITVTLSSEQKYGLKAIMSSSNGVVSSTERPGETYDEEDITYQSPQHFFDGMRRWAARLDAEIRADLHVRKIEELRATVAEQSSWLEQLPERFFTREEGRDLANRLDAIEKRARDELQYRAEVLRQTDAELNEQLTQLSREMQELRREITTIRANKWAGKLIRGAIWRLLRNSGSIQPILEGVVEATQALPPSSE